MPDTTTHMILQGTCSATAAVTSAGLHSTAFISWRGLSSAVEWEKNSVKSAGQGAAEQGHGHNTFGNGNIQIHSKQPYLQTVFKW